MKKLISVVTILALIFSFSYVLADGINTRISVNEKNELIKKAVFDQIEDYILSETALQNRKLSLSSEFLDLYDIDGNPSGYMIPVLENNMTEVGYVSAPIYGGKCEVQEISIDYNTVTKIKDKFQKYKKTLGYSSNTSKIIFIPPMNYFNAIDNGNKLEYIDINSNKVTELINKSKNNLHEINEKLKDDIIKSNNKSAENKNAEEALYNNISNSITAYVPVEDVRLV